MRSQISHELFFPHLAHCRNSEIIVLEMNSDVCLDVFGIVTWLNIALKERQ